MIALNPQHTRGENAILSPADLTAALNWRYAVKQYDASRPIEGATWDALEEALVLTPSSVGLQPWHFIVVDDKAVRARLREASWGQPQVTDADKFVVLAARVDFSEADVDRFIARIAQVRGVSIESLAGLKGMAMGVVARPQADRDAWSARQTYIALGTLLTAAATLGVDATPMEGLDTAAYDDILGLTAKGYRTFAAAAVGYRAHDDKYATLPKVRFAREDVVKHV
jgi:nitroreductase